MANEELLSKTISALRFPLTVGVVFIHFNLTKQSVVIDGEDFAFYPPSVYHYIVTFFSDVLPRIAVPLFFLISGFLFFYRTDFNCQIYKRKLLTRVRTLLVPFFLWNLIMICMRLVAFLPSFSSQFNSSQTTRLDLSLSHIINTFFDSANGGGIFVKTTEEVVDNINLNPYPIDYPLWYVRDLMLMVILSPMIYWLVKKGRVIVLALLGIMWYVVPPVFLPYGGYLDPLSTALFFFSCGAYCSVNNINFVDTMRRFRFIPLVYIPIAVADMLTKETVYSRYIHELGILIGLVAIVVVASCLVEKGKTKLCFALADSSFFVFASHAILLGIVKKGVLKAMSLTHLPVNDGVIFALYFVVPMITIAICMFVYWLLKRYIPIVCNLLTGGR